MPNFIKLCKGWCQQGVFGISMLPRAQSVCLEFFTLPCLPGTIQWGLIVLADSRGTWNVTIRDCPLKRSLMVVRVNFTRGVDFLSILVATWLGRFPRPSTRWWSVATTPFSSRIVRSRTSMTVTRGKFGNQILISFYSRFNIHYYD